MKKACFILTLIAGLFFCSESLYAFGIGFYGDFNGGLTFGKYQNSHWSPGGGLVIDSNVAKDSIFNYRLELGYNLFNISWSPAPNTGSYYYDVCDKVSSNHYFGFGIIRTHNVRFWVGPQIEISGLFGQGHSGIFGGVGFAFGTNFNVDDFFTFSIILSLRAVGGMIYGNYVTISSYGNTETGTESFGFYGGNGRISMACIFRINDTYVAAKEKK